MENVEMRPAYSWDCPNCDAENFARGVVIEYDEDKDELLKEEIGIEGDAEGIWMLMPDTVQCAECGNEYNTVHYSESE